VAWLGAARRGQTHLEEVVFWANASIARNERADVMGPSPVRA
jgi:hypothetical protein